LILRGVAFEYRQKRPEAAWKRRWDAAIFFGSLVPTLLWGIAFANIVRGVPLTADHEYAGGLLNLLNPYALLGGAVFLAVFITHGAVFIALKTTGDIRVRANRLAARTGLAAAAVTAAFLAWTLALHPSPAAVVLAAAAALTLVSGLAANRAGREGWAFTGTAAAIAFAVATLFSALFPNVLPSTLEAAGTLTITNAASTPYTLRIMTWVAVICTPVVLAYQGWTYWVFRKRIGVGNIPH
ncbi:MAG TPA: cytochrome d ubiquinol oxidase subunit II, partial [Micromonosporaceae bacterium]|nr:cytochrome d ubiquinol oxidase subunit II [Micromonosporaceae bacterium]